MPNLRWNRGPSSPTKMLFAATGLRAVTVAGVCRWGAGWDEIVGQPFGCPVGSRAIGSFGPVGAPQHGRVGSSPSSHAVELTQQSVHRCGVLARGDSRSAVIRLRTVYSGLCRCLVAMMLSNFSAHVVGRTTRIGRGRTNRGGGHAQSCRPRRVAALGGAIRMLRNTHTCGGANGLAAAR